MKRELFLATIVSAFWLSMCFASFGVLYIGIGKLIDPSGLMQFEDVLGTLHYGNGISIPRLSLLVFGAAMFLACLPINYYWLRRYRGEIENDQPKG